MTGRPPAIIEYGAFREPPSALFRDYLGGSPRAGAFYDGGQWDLSALARAASAAVRLPRARREIADVLAAQQDARGATTAAAAARRLASDDAAAVVTGQQAVLFGGPLFVLYKALAALVTAARLEKERGAPVVPVFWIASDDHDFAEVRSASVLDEAGQIRTVRYTPEKEPVGLPAARITLDATITLLVAELEASLPASLHRDEVIERLGACYRPGATLSSAFSCFLSWLFPSLVVLDPADPALKRLMAPVMAREIRESSPTSRLATEVGERLLAEGYHQQVPVRAGFLNLFVFMNDERRALGTAEGTVEVRGLARRMPAAEAAALVESDPSLWSPGVLLRPLAQDAMLPVAAYVGGPAEVAYHAQVGPSYRHFGIPRPVILPRPSVTIIEPAQARALEAEGLTLPELQSDPEGILGRWAREANPDVEAAFTRARESIEREMADLEQRLGALDSTLRAAVDGARGRALHQVESLHEKATRALKKRDQTRADRLRRTRDALLPGGAFQERGLSLVSLVSRHGPAVVDDLKGRIDPWARGHQVVFL